jgi:hypothetical protein
VIYFCCDDNRRVLLLGNPNLNGIDYVEVLDDPSAPAGQRQRTLFVTFVNPVTLPLGTGNVLISGGERITGITVNSVSATEDPLTMSVRVDQSGDFSTYTLLLVADAADPAGGAPAGIDPALAAAQFTFKAACDTDFDCEPVSACPPPAADPPLLNYLAKDFPSINQLMLDRMAVTVPAWTERNPADVMVMLTEVLSYVADYLSYQQDAVATEAYLGTARLRVSVRRHARLVGYRMHDGCNSRVWARVQVSADLALPAHTPLLTAVAGLPPRIAPGSADLTAALNAAATVFETMSPQQLYADRDCMVFYTWDAMQCCLPAGATSATLAGAYPRLSAGDVLILAEIAGAETGAAPDADPARRWPVMITGADVGVDPLHGQPVTSIGWATPDALPFPLTVSRATSQGTSQPIAVAYGNIVLADQGQGLPPALLPPVPEPTLATVAAPGADPCSPAAPVPVPARYHPQLAIGPITQAAPLPGPQVAVAGAGCPPPTSSAAAVFRQAVAEATPAITLSGSDDKVWTCRQDLLSSSPSDPVFVAEVNDLGGTTLRFGDGTTHGALPRVGVSYSASYRIGNGSAGNIAAGSLGHIVAADPALSGVSNPLPAAGGTDPESSEHVRMIAPVAYRTQARAVTADDYAAMAERYPDPDHPEVAQAVATFRWTGSWRTVFVTVERAGGLAVDDQFAACVQAFLEQYRMAGQDVVVQGPVYVPLELDMTVFVDADHFAGDVEQAIRAVFTNGQQPNGQPGVFAPANFSFGQTVYDSPFLAAAQAVDGVDYVEITAFGRWGDTSQSALLAGQLQLGRLELPRLDNDPSLPDRGVFVLTMCGGK